MTWMQPRRAGCQLVVDNSNLGTQPTDVNRRVEQRAVHPESMQHREHLLRFAKSKDRNQDRSSAFENPKNRLQKSIFFS